MRIENPEYPKNFINDAVMYLDFGKIVVSPFIEHVFKAYDSNEFKSKVANLRVILVCPTRNNFGEYVERFKKRGNNEEFIARREAEFSSLIDLFDNAKECEKIVIKPGQFLSEALIEHGIELCPKESIDKNNINNLNIN